MLLKLFYGIMFWTIVVLLLGFICQMFFIILQLYNVQPLLVLLSQCISAFYPLTLWKQQLTVESLK